MSFLLLDDFSKAQIFTDELENVISKASSNDFIRVVIKVKGKLNINEIKLLTKDKNKVQTHEIVRNKIKAFANQYQSNLLDYLNHTKAIGNTKFIKSIAITNKIIIESNKIVLENLKNRSDIEAVYIEHPQKVICGNTWSVEKINAHQVWSAVGIDGTGVKVGILDSGIDYNHTDLHTNTWNNLGEDSDSDGHTLEWNGSQWILDPGDINGIDDDGNEYVDDLIGWNFVNNSNDPMEDFGHGTHVSGIIAGDGTGGTQTGVAPGASLIPLKVLAVLGYGIPSDVELAINYAIDNNLDVLNLSIGWIYNYDYEPGSVEDPRADFRTACDLAIASGIVMCVAAGNERDDYPEGTYNPVPHQIRTPGDVPSVITVGATNSSDVIVSFSSSGPVTWSDVPEYGDYSYPPGLLKPDISAPGDNITSTYYQGYSEMSGTSMATPAVSGTVALLLQANPSLTPTQIKDLLQQVTIDLGPVGKDGLYGSGRVEAFQSMLLSIAYSNESSVYSSTAHNNNHSIERGYFGKLHEVFQSGGEIFYCRSSNNGSTWDITKRISGGNGSNTLPSLVAVPYYSRDAICVVWQQKIDSRHYKIWSSFSSNEGISWSTPEIVNGCFNVYISYYQSPDYYGPGPTPVVASFTGFYNEQSLLLVYAAENGLHFRYATYYGSGWYIPSNDILPGSSGSNSYIWFPSLATYNSGTNRVNLIYGRRFGSTNDIYSQIYTFNSIPGSWSSPVAIDWLGSYNRLPSLAIDNSNRPLGVWSGFNGSNYTIRFRRGNSDGTWSSWEKEWSISGYDLLNPVVTYYNSGGSNPYGIDIL